ncbi:MAG: carboxypeptidase-like regulatory domain-containing protein [Chitinophagaceae bacterium]
MRKKQTLRLLQFCLLFFLLTQQVAAQTKTITGKITNSAKGEPLAGATISEKGTTNTTNTKEDGSFSLPLRGGTPKIVISYIGYESIEIDVNNKTTINQALTSVASSLSDVVVVGYGSLNRKEVTSSITHLNSKDLLTVGGNGALMSLQGKVAGLSVTNVSTADPNSSPSIQLRGVSSRSAGLGPCT